MRADHGAREEAEALPVAAGAQCEASVVGRAQAVLADLADRAGSGEPAPEDAS